MRIKCILRDPITEDRICSDCVYLDISGNWTIDFEIKRDAKLFKIIERNLVLLQTYPFFLDFPLDNRTDTIVFTKVWSIKQLETSIKASGRIKIVSNLEFFRYVHRQRYLYKCKEIEI